MRQTKEDVEDRGEVVRDKKTEMRHRDEVVRHTAHE
jgi:hypothetical protein